MGTKPKGVKSFQLTKVYLQTKLWDERKGENTHRDRDNLSPPNHKPCPSVGVGEVGEGQSGIKGLQEIIRINCLKSQSQNVSIINSYNQPNLWEYNENCPPPNYQHKSYGRGRRIVEGKTWGKQYLKIFTGACSSASLHHKAASSEFPRSACLDQHLHVYGGKPIWTKEEYL